MLIHLERTGGFAGIAQTKTIDADKMPNETHQQLTDLLIAVDFFNLPIHFDSQSLRPDRFYYSLTVEDKGQKHTVSFSETTASSELKAILNILQQIPSDRS